MGWIATFTQDEVVRFGTARALMQAGTGTDAPMPRGSLVVETRMPVSRRPVPVLRYRRSGAAPFLLSLVSIPGGGFTLVVDRAGEIAHCAVNHSEAGRMDALRITYSWDVAAGRARLAIERTDQDGVLIAEVQGAGHLRLSDVAGLFEPGADLHLGPDLIYLALSDLIEPVGPMPTLSPETQIATPEGYRPIARIGRGDTVITASGEIVPVLHRVSRTVPGLGSFRPVRIRAPFFGLKEDIHVAPGQRLVLSGSDVEYLFGQEAVLVPAAHLAGGTATRPGRTDPLVTYMQLLLPGHEALLAAGTAAESLYIGRLRRRKAELAGSLLAGLDRAQLPEHAQSIHPVLRAYDALVLADQRAA